MKRSVSVTLTLVATLGTARAQQGVDPCDAATFNATVCRAAVRGGSYCSNGARTKMRYQQSYPYYYDRYRDYVSQGGVVNASPAQTCPGGWLGFRGGFGTTAAGHAAESKAGG
jgi:hypothetical protein